MKCAYCKYNDEAVYTSMPPKYRCTITNEFHLALDDCNVEFAPVKHGRWIDRGKDMCIRWKCSECGRKDTHIYNYCPDCGALMMDESTMSQVKVDVSIKKPTKRWDTCGLTENSVLVDSGARGEKVDEVEE